MIRTFRAIPALVILLGLPVLARAQPSLPPDPSDVLGAPLGARFTDVAGVERYFEALAGASDRVSLDRYGTTPEGRPLLQVLVAHPRHRARLDAILRANLELADPVTTAERAAEIAATNPVLVYLTYGIHGNESASAEAAMWTAWELASGSSGLGSVLDSVIVVLDPVANPDGRDRYVQRFRQVSLLRPNGGPNLRERQEPWPGGRLNHYLFDLNRDWAWRTQPETRGRLERYHRYRPQVHVDFHEMAPGSSYFFFPAADPINPVLPDHVLAWAERFGAANARAMDREGLLYFTAQDFDLFYPGYGDSFPSLLGAVGMTYEQGGGGRAGLRILRPDGTLLTLADRIQGHRITAAATLRTAAEGRHDLLLGFAELHRQVEEGLDDVYLVPGEDPSRADALVDLLLAHGVRVERTEEEVRIEAYPHHGFSSREVLPGGTFRVRARQPQGRLAAALLRPDNFLAGPGSNDITAWALPYAYGVEAHSSIRDASGVWSPVEGPVSESGPGEASGPASYGYLLPPSFARVPGLIRFLEDGGRALVLSEAFRVDGRDFPRGTLFFPRSRNEGLDALLQSAGLAGAAVPVASGRTSEGPDLGTRSAAPLRLPRILLAAGEGTTPTSVGAHWYFLEQVLDAPFDMVDLVEVGRMPLGSYDVVVLPSGSPLDVLDEEGLARMERWIREGGTLLAFAEAARTLGPALAGVELRATTEPDDPEVRLERALRSREERELDGWRERTPGTILEVQLDLGHPLAYGGAAGGRPDRTFILSGGTGFEPGPAFESVAHFPEGVDRVSGVISDATLGRLEQSVWLGTRTMGRGSVVLFADDPLFRMFWYGGFQFVANALLLAPAFGGAP